MNKLNGSMTGRKFYTLDVFHAFSWKWKWKWKWKWWFPDEVGVKTDLLNFLKRQFLLNFENTHETD